jgi:hypothetical protein
MAKKHKKFDFTGKLELRNGKIVRVFSGPNDTEVRVRRTGRYGPTGKTVVAISSLVLVHTVDKSPMRLCWAFQDGSWICWLC